MKTETKLGLAMALCVVALVFSVMITVSGVNKDIEAHEELLGTEYVIDGDTLMVVDYSLFDDSFTLSNGIEVSSYLIEKENE